MPPSIRACVAIAILLCVLLASSTAQAAAVPGNDNLSNAYGLSGYYGIVVGSNINATSETGEPLPNGPSVWYSWTAPTSGTVRVGTLGSDFHHQVVIYKSTSTTVQGLSQTQANYSPTINSNPAPFDRYVNLTFTAVAGTVYKFFIGGISSPPVLGRYPSQGKFVLSWAYTSSSFDSYVLPPAGGAFLIAPGGVYGTEGQTGVQVPIFRLFGGSGTITATAAFTGIDTAPGDFTPITTDITFEQGQTATFATFDAADNTVPQVDRRLKMSLTSTTPGIVVYDYSGGTFGEAITIRDNEHPANDDWENATVITGLGGAALFSNQGATTQTGEPIYKHGAQHSVWYKWVAPKDGIVLFRNMTFGSSVGGAGLFTGTSLANLLPVPQGISSVFSSGEFRLREGRWKVTSGTTYYAVLDDVDSNETLASGQMNWSMSDPSTFEFSADTYTAFETVGSARLTVSRTSGTGPATLTWSTIATDSTANVDFDATPGTLTFAFNETTKDIIIPVTLDTLDDNGETFRVILGAHAATPYLTFGRNQATVYIRNNDLLARPFTLTGPSGSIEGSTAGSTAHVPLGDGLEPVHGSPASTTSVWYSWKTNIAGSFSFGATKGLVEVYSIIGGARTLVATPAYDAASGQYHTSFIASPSVTYNIAVSNPGAEGAPFVLSWGPGSTLAFVSSTVSAAENAGNAIVTFTRQGDTTSPIAVTVTPSSGTATAGIDFVATPVTAVFAAGEGSKAFSIPLIADAVHEVPETVNLTLTSIGGNAGASALTATLAIVDDDAFAPLAGNFQSLLVLGSGFAQNGIVTATVTAAKRATGRLTYGGKAYAFNVLFNAQGVATATFVRTKPLTPLILTIACTEGGQRLVFTLTDAAASATAYGDRQSYDARLHLAPVFGTYTADINASPVPSMPLHAPPTAPGLATARVTTTGALTFAGSLPDGAVFTLSTVLGTAPNSNYAKPHAILFIPLYVNRGYLRGDLRFDSTLGGHNDFAATLEWFKPEIATEKYWHFGLVGSAVVGGQRYTPPAVNERALPGLDGIGRFTLGLDGAGFDSISRDAYWLVNNKINTALFADPKVALTVYPATGIIIGTVTRAALRSPVLPAKAVILQATGDVPGFFLNPATATSGFIGRK